MREPVLTEYTLHSPKIHRAERPPVMVMLSDLHNREFGEKNCGLLKALEEQRPDAILIGGDMIIGKAGYSVKPAVELIRRLSFLAPVFHAMGNHEYRMKGRPGERGELYREYEQALVEEQVILLDNQSAFFRAGETSFCIHGLSLPLECYRKRRPRILKKEDMDGLLGQAKGEAYHILLAHSPRYAEAYYDWGADLTLSGHYHGGMLRLGKKGVISPYFTLFPPYSYGRFTRSEKTLIVSGGLGEHTIPFRFFNPRELVVLRFYPAGESGESAYGNTC